MFLLQRWKDLLWMRLTISGEMRMRRSLVNEADDLSVGCECEDVKIGMMWMGGGEREGWRGMALVGWAASHQIWGTPSIQFSMMGPSPSSPICETKHADGDVGCSSGYPIPISRYPYNQTLLLMIKILVHTLCIYIKRNK